jgi:hypothetical protein
MPMLKIRKPPEKALIVAAWFLAGLLFALISSFVFVEARAATVTPDDGRTLRESCTDACNREHTICVDSSGSKFDSNYNDENAFAGLKANCDRDASRCIGKCGVVSPQRHDPAAGATGN